jgi:S1-C subfamily serine protease
MTRLRSVCSVACGAIAAVALLGASVAAAPAPDARESTSPVAPAQRPGREETLDALSIVKVTARAMSNARSLRTLGPRREGTGVVLDDKGLVLTIGYLTLEAETIELSTADGRAYPAKVLAYDTATGFGLLRALGPLPIKPVQMGASASIADRERVLIVGFDGVAPAVVVSKRPFVGYWEYLLNEAIYTAPATVNWSGAALLDRSGKLLGIGSLAVNDATGPGSQVAGNLFVPIDLLKPMLGDLVARGKSAAPPRPWLGLQTQEVHGNVIVTRVSSESPADRAGLRPGDVIVALGGLAIDGQAEFYTRLWASGAAGVQVRLDVLRRGRIEPVTVRSVDRDTYYRVPASY